MAKLSPHFKVFVSLEGHHKTAALYQDNELLGCYVRLGMLMVDRFAQRTWDHIVVSGKDLKAIAQTDQVSGAVQRIRKLADCSPVVFLDPRCPRDAAEIPSGLRRGTVEIRSSSSRVWVLGLPNFARKQGFKSVKESDRLPSGSDTVSDTVKEEKKPSAAASGVARPAPKKASQKPAQSLTAVGLFMDAYRARKSAAYALDRKKDPRRLNEIFDQLGRSAEAYGAMLEQFFALASDYRVEQLGWNVTALCERWQKCHQLAQVRAREREHQQQTQAKLALETPMSREEKQAMSGVFGGRI